MEIPSNSHLSVRGTGKEFSCINLLSVVSQCLLDCWTNSLDTTINSENCQSLQRGSSTTTHSIWNTFKLYGTIE